MQTQQQNNGRGQGMGNQLLGVPEILGYWGLGGQGGKAETKQWIENGQKYLGEGRAGWLIVKGEKMDRYWEGLSNVGSLDGVGWKIVVPLGKEHVALAWDLIVGIFIHLKCRSAVKVPFPLEQDQQSCDIEIDILKYSPELEQFCGNQISTADQHSQDFWTDLIFKISQTLSHHKIPPTPLLTPFSSIQLTPYIHLQHPSLPQPLTSLQTPPECPLDLCRMFKKLNSFGQTNSREQKCSRPMYYFCMPMAIISVGFYLYAKIKNQ